MKGVSTCKASCGVVVGLFILAFGVGDAWAAGAESAPAIDKKDAAVSVTNGVPTCCYGQAGDRVNLLMTLNEAIDIDGSDGENHIDVTQTTWFCDSGQFFGPTGQTTAWQANAIGTWTVHAYLNDNQIESDPEKHDDAAGPISDIEVTGFKVGCNLRVDSTGGDYTKYQDGFPAEGNANLLAGTVTLTKAAADADGTKHSQAKGEWTAVVVPEGTLMKGSVRCSGNASGSAGAITVGATDNDEVHTSSATASMSSNPEGTLTLTPTQGEGDNTVAFIGCGLALQSSWLDAQATQKAVASVDSATLSQAFAPSSETKYFSAKPTDYANFRLAYFRAESKADTRKEDGMLASSEASASIQFSFGIPEDPTYNCP